MCSIFLFMLLHVTAKSLVERSHIQLTTWPDGPFSYVFPCCMLHVQWTAGKEPWLPCSWNKTRTSREIADFRGIFGIDEYTLPWKSENSNDLTVEKKGFDLEFNVFHLLPPCCNPGYLSPSQTAWQASISKKQSVQCNPSKGGERRKQLLDFGVSPETGLKSGYLAAENLWPKNEKLNQLIGPITGLRICPGYGPLFKTSESAVRKH